MMQVESPEAQDCRTIEKHLNRAGRYQKRLLREAFRKLKRERIPLEYYDLRIVRAGDPTVYIHRDGEGNVYLTPLLDLVKEDCPALYRKYERAMSICERVLSMYP